MSLTWYLENAKYHWPIDIRTQALTSHDLCMRSCIQVEVRKEEGWCNITDLIYTYALSILHDLSQVLVFSRPLVCIPVFKVRTRKWSAGVIPLTYRHVPTLYYAWPFSDSWPLYAFLYSGLGRRGGTAGVNIDPRSISRAQGYHQPAYHLIFFSGSLSFLNSLHAIEVSLRREYGRFKV